MGEKHYSAIVRTVRYYEVDFFESDLAQGETPETHAISTYADGDYYHYDCELTDLTVYDNDVTGECDTCGSDYDLSSRDNRCGDCGDCGECCKHEKESN